MRKALVITIFLVALPILGAVRATSPAVIVGSTRSVLEASSHGINERALPDPGSTRRTLGVWLLAMTGTAVVLRARSRAIR